MSRFDFRFNRSSIRRPQIQYWNQEAPSCVVGEPGPMVAIITIGWGDPYGDPVWQLDVLLPSWIAERLPMR